MAALALTVAISFMLTTLVYQRAHSIYGNWKRLFKYFERQELLPQDVPFQPHGAEVLVIGLGRVGRGAYQALRNVMGNVVWGMDADRATVEKKLAAGNQVFIGDGEDSDFWENFDSSSIKMILLALPTIDDALNTTRQIRAAHYDGLIGAVARYEDDQQRLLDGGIDKVFNFFTEAGTGFAEESAEAIYGERLDPALFRGATE